LWITAREGDPDPTEDNLKDDNRLQGVCQGKEQEYFRVDQGIANGNITSLNV